MGPGEFLSIDFLTGLFTLLNTIALFLVLKKYLFKPVMKMIDDRQQEIDDMYTQAQQAETQAKEMQAQYQQKLDQATQTSEKLVKEAVARGQSREEEIIRQANADAEAIRRKAGADIEREKKKALNDAKDQISVIALDIAGKVVGRELTCEDQSDLVDQFIEELGEGV